jgi:hypothetical protein
MGRCFMIGFAATLSACVETPPVVSDFNGDSVKVVTIAWASTEPTPATAAEANRICKAGGKSRAEYASTRVNSQTYEATHLYLCL